MLTRYPDIIVNVFYPNLETVIEVKQQNKWKMYYIVYLVKTIHCIK